MADDPKERAGALNHELINLAAEYARDMVRRRIGVSGDGPQATAESLVLATGVVAVICAQAQDPDQARAYVVQLLTDADLSVLRFKDPKAPSA